MRRLPTYTVFSVMAACAILYGIVGSEFAITMAGILLLALSTAADALVAYRAKRRRQAGTRTATAASDRGAAVAAQEGPTKGSEVVAVTSAPAIEDSEELAPAKEAAIIEESVKNAITEETRGDDQAQGDDAQVESESAATLLPTDAPAGEGAPDNAAELLLDFIDEGDDDEGEEGITASSARDVLTRILTARSTIAALKDLANADDEATPVERYLAAALKEANIRAFADKAFVRAVMLHRNGLVYLGFDHASLSFDEKSRLLRIEEAINVVCQARDSLGGAIEERDLLRFEHRLISTVASQAPLVDTADWSYLAMPWQTPAGPSDRGEWTLRRNLSELIECARMPYRLEVRFRANAAAGDVALEFDVTPPEAFPQRADVDGLGIVPVTMIQRRRQASCYAARVGLLLGAWAFAASKAVRRVWISAIRDTEKQHACLYSLHVNRRIFSHLKIQALRDPIAVLKAIGASIQVDADVLGPTEPLFNLEDERFCPRRRHDLWRLSERELPAQAAHSLGARRVSNLLIHEELPRAIAAERLIQSIPVSEGTLSAEASVRTILDTARSTSDLTVWDAAERMVSKIVSGTLTLDDPASVIDEMVFGDALSKALERSSSFLNEQNPAQALAVLEQALAECERCGYYDDSGTVVYRSFDTYVERVIYNRTHASDGKTCVLAPDAYVIALLNAAALLMMSEDGSGTNVKRALAHTQRACEVAPLSTTAHLSRFACLMAADDHQGARACLVDYLETAHRPEGIAIAYAQMADLAALDGDAELMQACYARCLQAMPSFLPLVIARSHEHLRSGIVLEGEMDSDRAEELLAHASIPVAPTLTTSYYLLDGAAASVDAEVFPVASDLMSVIEQLSGDDVIRSIRKSLEHEPDA